MKTTFRIAKTELRILYYSPIAWLVIIIFLIQCALTYTDKSGNLATALTHQDLGGRYLKYINFLTGKAIAAIPTQTYGASTVFLTAIASIYLYVPLLTMGIFSRELSSGTIKLLYSSPITIRQIVWGKFLAMMAYNLALIVVLLVFVFAGILNIKSADVGLMLSGLFGIYLLLCAYAAIGLFMSCLTSYQVVAAISTLATFAALYFVGTMWQDIEFVRDLTYFLSLSGRSTNMILGLISTKDILYFILIIWMFLSFSTIVLQSSRESKSRIMVLGKYVLVFLFVLAVGYLSSLPMLTVYCDTTVPQINTLTPNMQKAVEQMGKKPLQIVSYINFLDPTWWYGAPEYRNLDIKRWEPYLRFKPDIDIKYVYYYDFSFADPDFFKNNQGKNLKEMAEHRSKVFKIGLDNFKTPQEIGKIIDLRAEGNRYVMQLKYDNKSTFLRLYNDSRTFPTETEIAAALMRLMVKLPKIAFVEGEYERSSTKLGDREYGTLTSQKTFRYALINQGFDIETISLKDQAIPSDITALIIADPKAAFDTLELKKIWSYINKGGNILIAGEPGKQEILNPLIRPLGVQMTNGTLVQQSKDNAPNMITPYLTKDALALSKNLKDFYTDSTYVTMPGAAGLIYDSTGTFKVQPFLMSDGNSWNKKGKLVIDSADVVFNAAAGDEKKSFPLVLGLTRNLHGKEQRIVVTGDADFLSNIELTKDNTANFKFGTDLFGWFTYGQFPVDTERPASLDNRVTVTDKGFTFVKILFLGIFPGLLLITGSVFLIRRKRK